MSNHDHHHHTHTNEKGQLVRCYHECKNQVKTLSFWVMFTIGFPIEHAIWEKLPPFSWLASWLGL